MDKKQLAKMIDHTILKPDATKEEIIKICEEAKKYNFASVCINPSRIKLAKDILAGSEVNICTVIGFPLGATSTESKRFEAEQAIKDGATEVDMVINIGRLKDKDYDYVYNDIKAVVEVAKSRALTKVIIETCLLNDDEKVMACNLAKKAKADFVKTSTGFSTKGAITEDIKLMRKTVGETMGVKASGGVKTYDQAMEMINNGATRIGASASIAIINGQ